MTEKTLDEMISDWRKELSEYLEQMFEFSKNDDPLDALRKLSAMGSRARYMQAITSRSGSRFAKSFHYDEVNPFLDEVEMQFKIWSRVATLLKDEWEMTVK